MAQIKPIAFDYDGATAISGVLLTLLNGFPGLGEKQVKFSMLEKSGSISMFPTSGAAVTAEKSFITGRVEQICKYPFTVIYRLKPSEEHQKLKVKEFLDTLGRWLELQPVTTTDHDVLQALNEYPQIPVGKRRITSISRTSPAYCYQAYQDTTEDWAIEITLTYKNEFYRR